MAQISGPMGEAGPLATEPVQPLQFERLAYRLASIPLAYRDNDDDLDASWYLSIERHARNKARVTKEYVKHRRLKAAEFREEACLLIASAMGQSEGRSSAVPLPLTPVCSDA